VADSVAGSTDSRSPGGGSEFNPGERTGSPFGPGDRGASMAGPVVYLTKVFPRVSETFITNEIRELLRRGLDLRIVSLKRPDLPPAAETVGLFRRIHYLVPLRRGAAFRESVASHGSAIRHRPAAYLGALLKVTGRFSWTAWKRFGQAVHLARFCRRQGIRHVHAAFAHSPTSVAYWNQLLTGLPYSFGGHAKDIFLSKPRSLRRKLDEARFAWTCSRAGQSLLVSLGSRTVVHFGYHGIDLDVFRPPEPKPPGPDGRRRILCVARLVPKKGISYLVEAAARLGPGLDFEMVLVGSGPERESLEARARELGLQDRLTFLGSLSPREVRLEYAAAHVVVLPSVVLDSGDRDGIPNVLIEAMAMGVPVVSTDAGGIPELVEDGVTGLVVPQRAVDELSRAIEKTLQQPVEARKRSEEGRRRVAQRFDLHRNSVRLASLLTGTGRPNRCLYVTADHGVPVRGHKGASAHVRQIAGGLAAQGLEVRIVSPVPGPGPPEGNPLELPLEWVPSAGWLARILPRLAREGRLRPFAQELQRILYNLILAPRLWSLLRQWRPDLVYERYSLATVVTGVLCRRRRIPWFLEVNAPLSEEAARYRRMRFGRFNRLAERWILRRADHIFVVSHSLRRWALEIGVHPERVSVLPNGVDLERFHPGVDGSTVRRDWRLEPEEIVVLFAGSLKPWHGVHELLRAVADARAAGLPLRLVVVGEGTEEKSIGKRVRKKGLEGFVHLLGAVPQAELPALLQAADILVAPYLPQERFYFSPLKIMEYLAVGRPVIASRLGDIPDWVDESCGRLVDPGDLRSLVGALRELAADRDLRLQMGERAAERVLGEAWPERAREILARLADHRGERPRPGTLRVGYVLKMFPRFSETFILNEVLELEGQDTEVRIFSMKRPAGPRQADTGRVKALCSVLPETRRFLAPSVMGIHLRCFFGRPSGYLEALRFALTRYDWRALAKFVQAGVVADAAIREGIGHLHAHFASGPTRVAKLASMISGLPFSFTAHAKDLYWDGHHHESSHKLKKRIQRARFVVAVSQENKRFIESRGFKVKEGRVRPIRIGLRMEEFPFRLPSERPPSPRPLILAVGRLIEKKGFDVLIDALALLRDGGVRFRCVVAGEGPEREALLARRSRLGLDGHVYLAGSVPLARLRRRYHSRARVLVQPSVIARDGDRDGIPTALVEAMALGVPVVSTPVSGIPEAIDDGVNGSLVAQRDAPGLAGAIRRLLLDDALADRLALEARRRAQSDFDLARNVGILRKLFVRSVAGWPPPVRPGEPAPEAAPAVRARVAPGADDGVLAGLAAAEELEGAGIGTGGSLASGPGARGARRPGPDPPGPSP
jgi:colanic acid/amylovoran biosynthesis glycosyltransferase